jgi:hypothetical protein
MTQNPRTWLVVTNIPSVHILYLPLMLQLYNNKQRRVFFQDWKVGWDNYEERWRFQLSASSGHGVTIANTKVYHCIQSSASFIGIPASQHISLQFILIQFSHFLWLTSGHFLHGLSTKLYVMLVSSASYMSGSFQPHMAWPGPVKETAPYHLLSLLLFPVPPAA